MNPRRRRHNRLVRKGTARFQLTLLARRRARQAAQEAVSRELGDELQKFVGRRTNGELRQELVEAAAQKILQRILLTPAARDVVVRRVSVTNLLAGLASFSIEFGE